MNAVISPEQQQFLIACSVVFSVFIVASVLAYSALTGRRK